VTPDQPAPEGDLDPEQVDAQEALAVPARDDLSMIAAEPTGSKHGDAEAAERVEAQLAPDQRPDR
jgi:hypothetical protein